MPSELSKFVSAHLELVIGAIVAIAGGFAGAWAGARAAQKTADRSKNRDEGIREIRNTNAAIMVVAAICNSMLGLKKQHVKPIKEAFDAHQAEFDEYRKLRKSGQIAVSATFDLKVDGRTLALPSLPIDVLQRTVFKDLSLVGRPLALQIVIGQTAQSLTDSISKRNDLVSSFKNDPAVRRNLVSVYFGLQQSTGVLDESYPSTLDAMNRFTDDLIFFSLFLLKDLKLHGTELSIAFRKTFGGPLIQTSEADFSQSKNLFPDEANYHDWLANFEVRPRAKSKTVQFIDGQITKLKKLAPLVWKNR